MKINDLLSPGLLSNGIKLRVEASKAISSVQIMAMRTPGGRSQTAKGLSDFFADCVTKVAGLFEVVLPTIVSRTATLATQVNIVFSEPMDQTVVPALTAFTSAGNTITLAAWTSSTNLRITGTGFAAAENFTYTQPAVSYLRDLAGNAVATSSANLV
jgi:hypothetical protein